MRIFSPQGSELLVWYGDSYDQFLGIPVSLKGMTANRAVVESDHLQSKSNMGVTHRDEQSRLTVDTVQRQSEREITVLHLSAALAVGVVAMHS